MFMVTTVSQQTLSLLIAVKAHNINVGCGLVK